MKTKLLSLALALLPIVAWAQIQADGRFLHDGIYYNLHEETMTASVAPYSRLSSSSYTGDVSIPAAVTTEEGKTYAVDEIESRAFYNARITSFTSGENIKKIGSGAFERCTELKSATIHGMGPQVTCTVWLGEILSLKEGGIGSDMFSGCTSLESITFGPSVGTIGDGAFTNHKTLKEVHFSEGVYHIGQSAFSGCAALSRVSFPTSIRLIGSSAFSKTGLTSVSLHPTPASSWTYWLPYNGAYSGDTAGCHLAYMVFENCVSLALVDLNENVSMRGRCFRGTAWETAQADGVLYMGDMAVGYKGEATPTIVLKEGTKKITGEPFYDAFASSMVPVEMTLPQSLEIIDDYSFYQLAVSTLTIPKNVAYVGLGTFARCTAKAIYLQPTTPPAGTSFFRDPSYSSDLWSGNLFVPTESLSAYMDNWDWSEGNSGSIVLYPYDGADAASGAVYALDKEHKTATITKFTGTNLVVPASISHEGESYAVTALYSNSIQVNGTLTLPETLKTISREAISISGLDDTGNLGTIRIPASVEEIATRAIVGEFLVEVDAANPVYDSREGCNSIIRTATNTLILAGTGCTVIPTSVTAIGDYAFARKWALHELTLPAGLKSVGQGAFVGCDSITSLHIPASLTDIGFGAFSGCLYLTHIDIDSQNPVYERIAGLNAIVEKATKTLVQGCAIQAYTDAEGNVLWYDRTLIIPNGITRIGDYAFGSPFGYSAYPSEDKQKTINEIVLPPSCNSIGREAFMYFPTLQSLTVRTKERLRAESYLADGTADRVSSFGEIGRSSKIYIPVGTLEQYYDDTMADAFYSLASSGRLTEGYDMSNFSLNDADMTATVTYASADEEGRMTIPATAEGYYEGETYAVTTLGTGKWVGGKDAKALLKEVTLPETITTLTDNVFNGCSELTAINLPEGLEYIGASAFYGCGALEGLTLPSSVNHVGYRAFYNVPITQEVDTLTGLSYFGTILYSDQRQPIADTIVIREGTTVLADQQFQPSASQRRRTTFVIDLPKSLKGIAPQVFGTNVITANVVSRSITPPTLEYLSDGNNGRRFNITIDTLYVPANRTEDYLAEGYYLYDEFISTWRANEIIELEAQTFTLTYMVDGELYQTEQKVEGTPLAELPTPADREGYLFTGWTLEDGGALPAKMPDHDLTVVGSFLVDGVVSPLPSSSSASAIYDLSGRRLTAPQRGVNLLRMSDGTTRRVLVR